jgi:hypothetical protein
MGTTQAIERRTRNRARREPVRTVRTSVMVTLTDQEAQLLRFFADRCGPPPVRLSRYTALHAQGLIYHTEGSSRYLITELGRQTVEALDPA